VSREVLINRVTEIGERDRVTEIGERD